MDGTFDRTNDVTCTGGNITRSNAKYELNGIAQPFRTSHPSHTIKLCIKRNRRSHRNRNRKCRRCTLKQKRSRISKRGRGSIQKRRRLVKKAKQITKNPPALVIYDVMTQWKSQCCQCGHDARLKTSTILFIVKKTVTSFK